jgi:hypothetical protein
LQTEIRNSDHCRGSFLFCACAQVSQSLEIVNKICNNTDHCRVPFCIVCLRAQVSPSLETGVALSWSSLNPATSFGIGVKYVLDDGACLR